MEPKMIADLKPGDGDEPIEIKVMRKWISFGTKRECCFMFVDKNGAAIQATADLNDRTYFDSQLKVDTCYRITKYICDEAKTFMRSVPHETAIMVGKATKFQQIPNNGFPDYYSNFVRYDDLAERTNNNEKLTGLQLTGTPASHIYINPKIPQADEMTAQFVLRDADNKIL